MRGKKKHEWVPEHLVKHIERKIKDTQAKTRIEAMEQIARELDELIIKKRKFNLK